MCLQIFIHAFRHFPWLGQRGRCPWPYHLPHQVHGLFRQPWPFIYYPWKFLFLSGCWWYQFYVMASGQYLKLESGLGWEQKQLMQIIGIDFTIHKSQGHTAMDHQIVIIALSHELSNGHIGTPVDCYCTLFVIESLLRVYNHKYFQSSQTVYFQ